MKIDCDVLKGKNSQELSSNREVLGQTKTVPLGDQEFILRCLSLCDVVSPSATINEVLT
jgi:hypothetical protein